MVVVVKLEYVSVNGAHHKHKCSNPLRGHINIFKYGDTKQISEMFSNKFVLVFKHLKRLVEAVERLWSVLTQNIF